MMRRGMARKSDRGEGGFTLIELLVAVTLLSLVMMLALGGLRFGTRVWETAGSRFAESARLEIVQGFIRRTLQRAQPIMRTDDRSRRLVAFVGGRETMEFAVLMPAHLDMGGLHHVVLSAAGSGDDRRLALQQGLLRHDADGSSALAGARDGEETVLLQRISGVEFAYFGALERNDEPRWHDDWEGSRSLPTLVRLRVRFGDGDRRLWPDMVVGPRMAKAGARRRGGGFRSRRGNSR